MLHSDPWVKKDRSALFVVAAFPAKIWWVTETMLNKFKSRPHECVFKSLRFHFTENAMKMLRPHDRFHIVLPVHTETMKTLSTFYCACVEDVIKFMSVNLQLLFSVDILHIGFFKWKWTGTDNMTNRFQKFAFSVNSTRPHEADAVAFWNLSTLENVFKSLRFHRKRYIAFIVFVWTGHDGRDLSLAHASLLLPQRMHCVFINYPALRSNFTRIPCDVFPFDLLLEARSSHKQRVNLIWLTHLCRQV